MEFNFRYSRLLLLTACLAGFTLFGGFTPPEMDTDGFHRPAQVTKAWSYCIFLFGVGAVSVSLIEHRVGLMDPTNLRPAYILLGVLLMVAALLWLRTLKQAVEGTA